MKLWFETHATSTDNERGLASGYRDAPLSATGRVQAAELGTRYAERALRRVYTSDLERSTSTAQIAFGQTEIERVPDRRLRECDYGSWSGCSVRQMDAGRADFVDQPFPGGESFRDVVCRVESFLHDLAQVEGPVLIIGHRAPWYALEHLINGRDLLQVVSAPWTWQPGWEYELLKPFTDGAAGRTACPRFPVNRVHVLLQELEVPGDCR